MICVRGHYQRYQRAAVALSLALCLGFISAAQPLGAAQSPRNKNSGVIVVGNDRGGLVSRRVTEIQKIRAGGQRVEIRGRLCLSTCTMYLGLPQTCVSPTTVFGFHGPSYYGTPLSTRDFEYWSNVIAKHYPEPIRSWYLREGRTRVLNSYRIKGRQLIRMGISQC